MKKSLAVIGLALGGIVFVAVTALVNIISLVYSVAVMLLNICFATVLFYFLAYIYKKNFNIGLLGFISYGVLPSLVLWAAAFSYIPRFGEDSFSAFALWDSDLSGLLILSGVICSAGLIIGLLAFRAVICIVRCICDKIKGESEEI